MQSRKTLFVPLNMQHLEVKWFDKTFIVYFWMFCHHHVVHSCFRGKKKLNKNAAFGRSQTLSSVSVIKCLLSKCRDNFDSNKQQQKIWTNTKTEHRRCEKAKQRRAGEGSLEHSDDFSYICHKEDNVWLVMKSWRKTYTNQLGHFNRILMIWGKQPLDLHLCLTTTCPNRSHSFHLILH